jgi:hypothetical protein
MESEVNFRIVLEKPPADVDFALQKGRGGNHEIVQKRSGSHDLVFEFTATAKSGARNDSPNLLGPFVQGPAEARFVYIGIGAFAGQADTPWSRRLKVPLSGITVSLIYQLADDPEALLETHIPGTGKDGSPNCATVKPFAGWKVGSAIRKEPG